MRTREIDELQQQSELYTKRIEMEKRRGEELEKKLMVRRGRGGGGAALLAATKSGSVAVAGCERLRLRASGSLELGRRVVKWARRLPA